VEQFFGLANLYASRMIELKCGTGGHAERCLTDEAITVPTKMVMPVIRVQVKQRSPAATISEWPGCLYRKQLVEGVYRQDERALVDDFFHFRDVVVDRGGLGWS